MSVPERSDAYEKDGSQYIIVSTAYVLFKSDSFDSELFGASNHTELFPINVNNNLENQTSYS